MRIVSYKTLKEIPTIKFPSKVQTIVVTVGYLTAEIHKIINYLQHFISK